MKRGPPPPIDGLSWPVTGTDEEGKEQRSTQTTGKEILAAALGAVDETAADAVRNERGWRFKYRKHFVKSVEVSARSPDAALKVAAAGLDYMYDKFEFIRDGKTYVLRDALSQIKGSFSTGFVKGSKPKPSKYELEVPYNGTILKGDSLQKQIDKWVRQGVCELSCGAAISQVASAEPWLDLSDRYFVLLGAGAAMGPFQVLLSLGANIIAVDIGRPEIWKRLISQTKDSCGTITFPMTPGFKQPSTPNDALYEASGCNLFTQTPEIKNWLREVTPAEGACVGGYAYIPGDLFPRVALAMDVIIKELVETRGAAVAFLCTPTDAHLVPAAAHAAAKAAIKTAPLWQKMANLVSMGKWCVPNARKPITTASGETLYVCDALVVPQGPNYALAKRMQHWRAMLSRASGSVVSSNVAPSTRTLSVMQNKLFSYGYATMHHFRPFEIPGPELSNSVMTALLIHDLREPMHAGHPDMPLVNPQQIFSQGSFHGGAWRCAFTFDSIGAPSVLLYYVLHFLVKYYLAAYNAVQTAGWGYVLFKAVAHYFLGGVAGAATAWDAFGAPLFLFQNLAGLEVAHAATGMVRAGFATTLLQVFSRFAIVYIMAYTPSIQDSWSIQPTVFAWSITEVIRYSWYALNTLGAVPTAHTWLRFTTFLPLYPLGVFGEMAVMHAALPAAAGTLVLGAVPIDTVTYYMVYPLWLSGLALLYTHMLSQRTKVLAKARAQAGKNKDA